MLDKIASDKAFHEAIAGGTTMLNELSEGSYEWDGTATGEVTYSDDYVAANYSTGGSLAYNFNKVDTGEYTTVIFGDMSDGNGGLLEDVVVYSTDSSLVGTAKTVLTNDDGVWTDHSLVAGTTSSYVSFTVGGEDKFIIESGYNADGQFVDFFAGVANTKLEAYVEGYKQGFSDGYVSGYKDGYDDGLNGRDAKH